MSSHMHKEKDEIMVTLPESFSVDEVSEFRNRINEMIQKGEKQFVLDFSKCSFIDSTGLGVIVAAYKKCREQDGNIRLKSLNAQVLKVFQLTRLDKVFDII
jgi:anti-sigma B factor antagonist